MSHDVDTVLKSLLKEVSPNVEMRLKAINKIIHGFKKNNVDLTVPNVVGALEATGIKISSSSLYNKMVRGKPNPYRVLFDAWSNEINKEKVKVASTEYSSSDFTSMSDADFATIGSDVVKFKIQTLYNELKSARHQINMLKQIHQLPTIEDNGENLVFRRSDSSMYKSSLIKNGEKNVVDDENVEIYVESIEYFLKGSSKVEFDEDGCLIAKTTIRKGDILSDLDLKEALEAALRLW